MTTSNDTVYIYALQRISDRAYLYIGSARNPKKRFYFHKKANPYPIIRQAFTDNDIRFLVLTSTDENHRFQVEAKIWKQFKDAGHPIVNRNPINAWVVYGPRKLSEETKRKISAANKGRPMSESSRIALLAANTGRKINEETRNRLCAAQKGHAVSDETRAKLSAAHKGKRATEETRQKMSQTRKGRKGHPHSEETKAMMSRNRKGRIAPNKGIPHSPETRAKISAAVRKHNESKKNE